MRLGKILEILQELAPEHLAESWDRVGLQLGEPSWRVARAMLCIDLTMSVLAEAIEAKADLIVSYHPPIFKPLERLSGEDWKQQIILEAASRRIAIYSPHTALDAATGGINDWLCEGLGPGPCSVINPQPSPGARDCKIVTFVPSDHVEKLRSAMSATGAGRIGDYVECSFASPGHGTFRPLEGTDPFVGKVGKRQSVEELRMEMICPDWALPQTIAALRKAHPYEEPAFDIFRVQNPPALSTELVGQGRALRLARPISINTLVRRVKEHLGVKQLEVAVPSRPSSGHSRSGKIGVVAVCAGAGGSVVSAVPEADAYVTGEMRHHEVLGAAQRGIVVLLAGHSQTERPFLKIYRRRILASGGAEAVQWRISSKDRPPSSVR